MRRSRRDSADTAFVDTPRGIFTASGIWFRTREAMLKEYAGAVFAHEPLAELLAQAEVWLRSPQTLALWVLPFFLLVIGPVQAAAAALVVYLGWRSLGPSFVSRIVARGFRVLDVVLLQALCYVVLLSWLAAQGQYAAVWTGLGGFVLLRWGLVQRATQPLIDRIWASLYALPVPDQVLRALIVRAALAHRVSLPQIDRIERDILDTLHRHKNRSS